ncbi:MAG: Xaa-Pro peptidase family protein [bacterium]
MFNQITPELMDDLTYRWMHLQTHLKAAGADALVVSSNVNNYYVTGRIFMGHAIIPAEGAPLFCVRRPVGLKGDRVREMRKMEQIPDLLAEVGIPMPSRVLIENDELSYSEWSRLAAVFPNAVTGNGSALLRQCRMVKSPYEVRIMKKTGQRHADVISRFPSVYEPGMTDHAWAVEMYHVMLKAGNLGQFRIAGSTMEAFMGTILAGDNGGACSPYDFALGGAGLNPSLPVGQSNIKMVEGMAVLVDIAGNFYGYITDCSRVFGIGKLAQKAYDAHQVSIDIRSAIMEAGKPGIPAEDLYNIALQMAEKAGLADYFMGAQQKAKFVGHGTGIVINELPILGARSKDIIAEGMTIALEPKFVIPGTGAVGVEDTLLVTANGMENLTPAPSEIITL